MILPFSSGTSSPDLQKEGERGPLFRPEASACATLSDLSIVLLPNVSN